MSFSLSSFSLPSSISLIGTQVASLADLFIGGVLLGAFIPTGLDVPEKLPFGGTQQTTVHKLLGGAKVIDLMGPDEHDITLEGILTGPLAAANALIIDTMRQTGQAVPLIWPGDARTVIVTAFQCQYANGGAILHYSITCMVIPDVLSNAAGSLLGQLATDANTGLSAGIASLATTVVL